MHPLITLILLVLTILASPSTQRGRSISARYQSLQDCLHAKGVPTTLNSSSTRTQITTADNLRLQYTLTAVMLAKTPQHVSDSVKCAAAASVKVQLRSGGHSYRDYSLGGKNGSLMLDLRGFSEVVLDKATSPDLALDRIVALDVVLADGSQIHTTPARGPDNLNLLGIEP